MSSAQMPSLDEASCERMHCMLLEVSDAAAAEDCVMRFQYILSFNFSCLRREVYVFVRAYRQPLFQWLLVLLFAKCKACREAAFPVSLKVCSGYDK